MNKHISGIYKITNILDNKVYIGQSKDITRRYSEHFNKNYCKRSKQVFHHLMLEYGFDNFIFEIIKETYDLDYWEAFFIRWYRSTDFRFGYNLTSGGSVGTKRFDDFVFTDEIKEKMSRKTKERWNNPEERERIIALQNAGKQTDGWKNKRKEIACNMWASGKFKNQAAKLSSYWKGKPKSEETKLKMKLASERRELKHCEDFKTYRDLGGKEPYNIFRKYYKKGINSLLEELQK